LSLSFDGFSEAQEELKSDESTEILQAISELIENDPGDK